MPRYRNAAHYRRHDLCPLSPSSHYDWTCCSSWLCCLPLWAFYVHSPSSLAHPPFKGGGTTVRILWTLFLLSLKRKALFQPECTSPVKTILRPELETNVHRPSWIRMLWPLRSGRRRIVIIYLFSFLYHFTDYWILAATLLVADTSVPCNCKRCCQQLLYFIRYPSVNQMYTFLAEPSPTGRSLFEREQPFQANSSKHLAFDWDVIPSYSWKEKLGGRHCARSIHIQEPLNNPQVPKLNQISIIHTRLSCTWFGAQLKSACLYGR